MNCKYHSDPSALDCMVYKKLSYLIIKFSWGIAAYFAAFSQSEKWKIRFFLTYPANQNWKTFNCSRCFLAGWQYFRRHYNRGCKLIDFELYNYKMAERRRDAHKMLNEYSNRVEKNFDLVCERIYTANVPE